jgi:hypothetical protein
MTSQTHRDTLPQEHSMATQTRRTIRRSARFFRATVKAYMVTACCGLILWSAVAAHAAVSLNGGPMNGMALNGVALNGTPLQGLPYNGMPTNGTLLNGLPTQGVISDDISLQATTLQREPLSAVPQESLPFHSLSQRALGTTPPFRVGFLSPCSRYRLGPLCL